MASIQRNCLFCYKIPSQDKKGDPKTKLPHITLGEGSMRNSWNSSVSEAYNSAWWNYFKPKCPDKEVELNKWKKCYKFEHEGGVTLLQLSLWDMYQTLQLVSFHCYKFCCMVKLLFILFISFIFNRKIYHGYHFYFNTEKWMLHLFHLCIDLGLRLSLKLEIEQSFIPHKVFINM